MAGAGPLDGRRFLVFGGGNGIGLEVVRGLLRRGGRVVIADRDEASPDRVGTTERVHFVATDARTEDGVDAAYRFAASALGGLDGVVTTVGGSAARPFEDLDLATWRDQIEFNLTTAYLVARAALLGHRIGAGGSVVLTSSGFSLLPSTERLPYVVSKAGLNAMVRSLALIAGPHRIRVNAVAPGPTGTARFRSHFTDAQIEAMKDDIPLGEVPTAAEVAETILFLQSDGARQITGQTLHVNGGLVLP